MTRALLALALALSIGCASVRHQAVAADVVLANAVFAVADAQSLACAPNGGLTAAQCTQTTPAIRQALVDVKAVSAAIKASPSGGTAPTSLASVMTNLQSVQLIVEPLSGLGPVMTLVSKLKVALSQAFALLSQLTGTP